MPFPRPMEGRFPIRCTWLHDFPRITLTCGCCETCQVQTAKAGTAAPVPPASPPWLVLSPPQVADFLFASSLSPDIHREAWADVDILDTEGCPGTLTLPELLPAYAILPGHLPTEVKTHLLQWCPSPPATCHSASLSHHYTHAHTHHHHHPLPPLLNGMPSSC